MQQRKNQGHVTSPGWQGGNKPRESKDVLLRFQPMWPQAHIWYLGTRMVHEDNQLGSSELKYTVEWNFHI